MAGEAFSMAMAGERFRPAVAMAKTPLDLLPFHYHDRSDGDDRTAASAIPLEKDEDEDGDSGINGDGDEPEEHEEDGYQTACETRHSGSDSEVQSCVPMSPSLGFQQQQQQHQTLASRILSLLYGIPNDNEENENGNVEEYEEENREESGEEESDGEENDEEDDGYIDGSLRARPSSPSLEARFRLAIAPPPADVVCRRLRSQGEAANLALFPVTDNINREEDSNSLPSDCSSHCSLPATFSKYYPSSLSSLSPSLPPLEEDMQLSSWSDLRKRWREMDENPTAVAVRKKKKSEAKIFQTLFDDEEEEKENSLSPPKSDGNGCLELLCGGSAGEEESEKKLRIIQDFSQFTLPLSESAHFRSTPQWSAFDHDLCDQNNKLQLAVFTQEGKGITVPDQSKDERTDTESRAKTEDNERKVKQGLNFLRIRLIVPMKRICAANLTTGAEEFALLKVQGMASAFNCSSTVISRPLPVDVGIGKRKRSLRPRKVNLSLFQRFSADGCSEEQVLNGDANETAMAGQIIVDLTNDEEEAKQDPVIYCRSNYFSTFEAREYAGKKSVLAKARIVDMVAFPNTVIDVVLFHSGSLPPLQHQDSDFLLTMVL